MTIKEVINNLSNNSNLSIVPFNIQKQKGQLIYFESTFDSDRLERYLQFLNQINDFTNLNKIFPSSFEVESLITIPNLIKNLALGKIYFYFEELNILYKCNFNSPPDRSISSSELDPVNLFGSKDSFVESIKKNYALILKRVKTEKLITHDFEIGSITKTDVKLIFIDGFVQKKIIKEIIKKLEGIDVKGIKTIGDLTAPFNKTSLVPLVQVTSSPEVVQNSLLNGRCIILCDNFPVAIVLPVTIDVFTNLPDEASAPHYYLFYTRFIIGILLFFSIFFLGLYGAIISYHSNSLSLQVISEIKASNRGSTLPLFGEILFITFIFEFLRIAASKTPSSYVQSLVITVGGLLIGQNTVSSGFVSPFNLVITTLCYLSAYGVTNNKHLIISFSYMRIFILILSLTCGLFGFIISSIITISYLNSQKNLSMNYLSPFTFKKILEMFSTKHKEASLASKEET